MIRMESIERWLTELSEDGMCDISDNQVVELIRCYKLMSEQLSNAESKCRGLAAENATMKECASYVMKHVYRSKTYLDSNGIVDAIQGLQCAIERKAGKTPATDAVMAEVLVSELDRLAGVAETMLVKFSNQSCSSDMHEVVGWKMVLQQATNRAAQLRKGVQS